MTYELAEELLKSAEELLESKESQEKILELLDQAEKSYSVDAFFLCRSARLLFRYGVLNSKSRFFLLALDKLKAAEEANPFFFDKISLWCQLWGNILIQLGKLLNDSAFFELAIEKYKKATNAINGVDPEVYWDWGEAWMLLGKKSGEPSDFQQGLAKFHKAQTEGIQSLFFYLEYGSALVHYGQLTGNPHTLEDALAYFRAVIMGSYFPDQEPSVAYIIAWRKLALAAKLRYELTHSKEHFDEVDIIFREAILATPKNKELWLDWGELYLHASWLKRDIKLAEVGLEKLTASKIKECNPLRASFLLGMGLMMFGLLLESLKLLNDGHEQINSVLRVAPDDVEFIFGSGFADLGRALYFSDEKLFARAAAIFESGINENSNSPRHLHALFQTYLAWGIKLKDPSLIQKGIKAINRLSELQPYSYIYLNEWGVSLLRLRQFENNREQAQGYIEEALLKFRRALELYNNDDEILYNLGCAFDLLGDLTADEEDYIKAIDLLTKVFEKRTSELHVRYRLGLALSHFGELTLNLDCLKQAIDLLDSVIKIDQDDECIWCDLGYALLNLSELVLDSTQPEEGKKLRYEAEKALTQAAKLGSGDAYYHLACLYSLSGYYQASLHYLQKAEKADYLPSKEDLEHDEWLKGVRTTDAFRAFLITWEKDG